MNSRNLSIIRSTLEIASAILVVVCVASLVTTKVYVRNNAGKSVPFILFLQTFL